MHGVERAPQRIERLIRGGHDFVGITFSVLLKPVAPCRAVRLVGFFVHRKIGQSLRISDAVKGLQPFNLGSGYFGHLRFVGVQSSNRFGNRAIAANLAVGLHHCLRAGKRRAVSNVVFRNTERDREIAPQLRM